MHLPFSLRAASTRSSRRLVGVVAGSLLLAGGAVAPGAAALAKPPMPGRGHGHEHGHGHGHRPGHGHEPTRRHLDLPDGFQPEGIAIAGDTAYLGSRADGDLYRLDLHTGKGSVLAQGPGTPSLGLKVGPGNRLFVSGGTGGDARVVDPSTGRTLASYQFVRPGVSSFINDVILTRDAAWFTDSASAQLFELPLRSKPGPRHRPGHPGHPGHQSGGPAGDLPNQSDVRRVPLTGAWQQIAGQTNANGITTTPDGRALLVVNSTSGVLYRVTTSGVAAVVDTGGLSLTNGDGLLRHGHTLYVVQNRDNRIRVLDLDSSGAHASLARTITSPSFDVPSTVAEAGRLLYLPNARFTTPATATTPYWVNAVER